MGQNSVAVSPPALSGPTPLQGNVRPIGSICLTAARRWRML